MPEISMENPPQDKPVELEILTVAVRPRIGGMTAWVEQIARGLAKQGWKVRLVGFSDRLDLEGREGYEVHHVPTAPIGNLPLRSLDKLSRWKSASRAFRKWRAGVPKPRLLLSDGTPGVLKITSEWARENEIPWAVLTGGNIFAETEGGVLSPLLQKSVRASMNAAARIFVDGADLVEALVARGIRRNLFRVQYHGVDLSRFPLCAGEPKYFAGEGPTPRVKLVWHGRLAEHHGPLRFARIAEAVEGAEARMCGGGDSEELEQVLNAIGKPHWWTGLLPAEALGAFLGEAQVGVYPLREMAGIPTVLLESMAAGLATLTHPVGAVSGLIRQGENGFVLHDSEETIRTIERLATDETLRRTIGENARRTIERDWSEEATLRGLTGHLEELFDS